MHDTGWNHLVHILVYVYLKAKPVHWREWVSPMSPGYWQIILQGMCPDFHPQQMKVRAKCSKQHQLSLSDFLNSANLVGVK